MVRISVFAIYDFYDKDGRMLYSEVMDKQVIIKCPQDTYFKITCMLHDAAKFIFCYVHKTQI